MNHTPGPWPIDYENSDSRSGGQWYQAGPAMIWYSYNSSEDVEAQALADATLVSAAPDLLALVMVAVEEIESGDEPGANSQWFKEAKAVLAKIEGKAQT